MAALEGHPAFSLAYPVTAAVDIHRAAVGVDKRDYARQRRGPQLRQQLIYVVGDAIQMEISVDLAETGRLDISPAKFGVGQLNLVDSAAALAGLEQEVTGGVRLRIAQHHWARLPSQGIGLVNHRAVAYAYVAA